MFCEIGIEHLNDVTGGAHRIRGAGHARRAGGADNQMMMTVLAQLRSAVESMQSNNNNQLAMVLPLIAAMRA